MPTHTRVKTFATGIGAYTIGVCATLPVDAADNDSEEDTAIYYVAPFVSGILPGWSTSQRPVQGTSQAHIVRAVYLTVQTTLTGTGVSGAGATGSLRIYRAGVTAVTVASLAFNTGIDGTAYVPLAITLSTTADDLKVRFGDLLVWRWAQGSTGLALPLSQLQVDLL